MTRTTPPPLLLIHGVSKSFGPVRALHAVDMEVEAGTVHALVGENGAGKSTLMKILSGGLRPDGGTIEFDGHPYHVRSPRDARIRGVSMIYQELTLAPHLSVAENITLGAERHTLGILRPSHEAVREGLERLGHPRLDPAANVGDLGMGEQQIVEIARALLRRSRLIIMDEPTSSLSADATRALFAAIRGLREQGVTIIYISHFLEEVLDIADAYTVLRDGETVASGPLAGVSLHELVRHMVGRPLPDMFPRVPHAAGDTLFSAEDVHSPPAVQRASLSVRRGEILGVAGLVGSGRTDLLRCLFGLRPAAGGRLRLGSAAVDLSGGHSPPRAMALGMGLVSENRKEEGLAVELPIRENVTLSSLRRFVFRRLPGVLNGRREASRVEAVAGRLRIKRRSIRDRCSWLSGGNQQKVALARLMAEDAQVLLLDEPTRGIDVGSKVEIYTLIGQFAAEGKTVVMVSSYLPELFGICDTIAVMFRGTLSPPRPVREWTQASVMGWATTGREI